jgi:hypothetical protein
MGGHNIVLLILPHHQYRCCRKRCLVVHKIMYSGPSTVLGHLCILVGVIDYILSTTIGATTPPVLKRTIWIMSTGVIMAQQ